MDRFRVNKVRFWLISFVLVASQGLSAQKDTTFVANGNPIIKYKYTADPGAMVHDGKVYIYAGHDECPPPAEHYLLNDWCVFSSSDMKTWTEHPVPLKAKDFSWAKGKHGQVRSLSAMVSSIGMSLWSIRMFPESLSVWLLPIHRSALYRCPWLCFNYQ